MLPNEVKIKVKGNFPLLTHLGTPKKEIKNEYIATSGTNDL